MVAAYVAATRPALVRGIFLEDCPYFGILSVERHRSEVSYALFESIRTVRLAMIEEARGVDWLTEQVEHFHAGRPGSTATDRDVAPATLLAGNLELGSAIRPDDLDRWRSTMPDLDVVTVHDTGHAIHMTPKTFPRYQAELSSFLNRVG